jgi:hypothetical protein
MKPDFRPPADQLSDKPFRRLLAAAKPDVAPLSKAGADRILAQVVSGNAGRISAMPRRRPILFWAPATALGALALLILAEPGGNDRLFNLPLPVQKAARNVMPVLSMRKRPLVSARMSAIERRIHQKRDKQLARAIPESRHIEAPRAVPVEIVATPILFDSGDLPVPEEAGSLSPVEVNIVDSSEQAGSANTISFDTGVDGSLVENSCTVSGTGSSDRIVATTSSAGNEISLFLSVEWTGDTAADPEENEP